MLHKKNFIATSVITVLTTTLFVSILADEVKQLHNYLKYIVENGKSALSFEEYLNKKTAFTLSKNFSAQDSQNKDNDTQDICANVEKIGDISGINLTNKNFHGIDGTLQTRNADCQTWSRDFPALADINHVRLKREGEYSFSNYTGYRFDEIKYYIDLANNYIYINKPVNSGHYTFNNWLVDNGHTIDISKSAQSIKIEYSALTDLFSGNSITSRIYEDGYTQKKIISMLTPVFNNGNLKGIFITNIGIESLAKSFYTVDRPYLWEFLNIYVTDNNTGAEIAFHKSKSPSPFTLDYEEEATKYYTLHIKLDYLYILMRNAWLVILYIVSTVLLCKYTKFQLIKHESLSKGRVTDTMTGLYNRKIITPALHEKIERLIESDVSICVIAIDSDGLKKINDTQGQHMGDKVIQNLGLALAQSIRKSDYGIRLGGDKFSLILIDNTQASAYEVISRVHEKLAVIDRDKLINFSYSCYQLRKNDTLESAFIKADSLLYQHKRDKYAFRHAEMPNHS